MYHAIDGNTTRAEYDGAQDFYNHLDAVINNKKKPGAPSRWAEMIYDRTYSREYWQWCGCTWSEATARRYGHDEAADRVMSLPIMSRPAISAAKIRTYDDQDGDDVDMERFMAGEERCLIRRVRRAGARARGIVRLIVSIATPANVTADAILWRTATAVRATDAIESAGNRCELVIAHMTESTIRRGSFHETIITAKRASEPIDLSLVAWLTSPGFYRMYIQPAIATTWLDSLMSEVIGTPRNPETDGLLITSETTSEGAAVHWLTENDLI